MILLNSLASNHLHNFPEIKLDVIVVLICIEKLLYKYNVIYVKLVGKFTFSGIFDIYLVLACTLAHVQIS